MKSISDHFGLKGNLSENELSIRHQRIMLASAIPGFMMIIGAIIGLELIGFHNMIESAGFLYMGIAGIALFGGGIIAGEQGLKHNYKANKAEKHTYDFSDVINDLKVLTSLSCWQGRCTHVTSDLIEMQTAAE